MIIENQEFIESKEAAQLLNYVADYMRVLCAKDDFRKKVDARKIVNRWFFNKRQLIEYGREKGRINNLDQITVN